MNPVQAVLFDLDGTLVQTRIASWEIFRQVNSRFGLGVDEPEQYFDLFRGNIYDSIGELCRDEAQAATVKAAFLQLLRSDYTPPLVPGIGDVVRRLAGHCTLAVMSSNAMQVLRRVLVANDLAFCFAHVFGGDVTPDKKTAMRVFLADSGSGFGRRCAADYDETGAARLPEPSSTVLVTDTAGDVREALEVGVRVVGVAWGMHSVEKLTEAGAEFVALWPQEIAAHLLGDAAALPPDGACALPAAYPAAGGGGDCGCGGGGACATPPRQARADDPLLAAAAVRRDRRLAAITALRARLDTGPASPVLPPSGPARTFPVPSAGSGMPGRALTGTDSAEVLAAVRRVVRR